MIANLQVSHSKKCFAGPASILNIIVKIHRCFCIW